MAATAAVQITASTAVATTAVVAVTQTTANALPLLVHYPTTPTSVHQHQQTTTAKMCTKIGTLLVQFKTNTGQRSLL